MSDTRTNSKDGARMDRAKAPKVGTNIVWRFHGNKGWSSGYVRAVKGDGRIVEIVSTFTDQLVAIADIEWYVE